MIFSKTVELREKGEKRDLRLNQRQALKPVVDGSGLSFVNYLSIVTIGDIFWALHNFLLRSRHTAVHSLRLLSRRDHRVLHSVY